MPGFLDGQMNTAIFRTVVSLALLASVMGSTSAGAQQPKPRPLETALVGPAIVQEPTTTIVLYPGHNISVLRSGNYYMETSHERA